MNKQIADLLQLDDNLAEKDYQARFKEIADVLLNSCDLVVQPSDESDAVVFQLAEIEFYVRGDSHDDVFTHGDPFQKEFLQVISDSGTRPFATTHRSLGFSRAQWYFHRSGPGKAYKEGSYRGFDLALGTPDMFCGVLVRSLRRVDDGSVVQGSCLSLNAILDALSFNSVAELADPLTSGDNLCAASTDAKHPLRLVLRDQPRTEPLYSSMRVGLTLKKADNRDLRLRFIGAPYRFFTCIEELRKGAPQIIAALAADGMESGDIANLTTMRPKSVQTHVDSFKNGRTKKLDAFVGKAIKAGEYADLYGRWLTHLGL